MVDKTKFTPGFLKLFKKMTSSIIQEQTDLIESESIAPTQKPIKPSNLDEIREILNIKSPFIYLTQKQKDHLLENSLFIKYEGHAQDVLEPETNGKYSCCLVIEGQLVVIDRKSQDSEVLSKGNSFGLDACLFDEVQYSVVTASNSCIVMKICYEDFNRLLNPGDQFTAMLGSNLLNKQRIFAPIETFRNYVADCVESGEIDLKKLLKAYKAIDSSLHPKRKSNDIDALAWKYSVQRLPDNLCSTFVYFISTSLPDMYDDQRIVTKVNTFARLRMIYCMIEGKNYIIMRELVSDINDMLANLCIHVIESKKLRYKLKGPKVLSNLLQNQNLDGLPLKTEEIEGIKKIWGDRTIEQIKNIMVHHEDYKVSIYIPSSHLKLSPIELWTEELWKAILASLDIKTSVVEAIERGLLVDFMQGSTRSIINAISPYIFQNEKKITDWFKSSGLKIKSTDLEHPRDKLLAMSFYYFKEFPEEKAKREAMEKEAGIVATTITHNTGVRVIVINISKMSKFNKSFNPKSKLHILLYIGFTFGKQSYDLVKNINLLLGKSLLSYTVVGKAGGLTGKRNDILVASRFFDEVSKNVMRANPAGISQSLLEQETSTRVHIGPMLTVSGTILQNKKMLLYYRLIEGCVGLEMEGAYIALSIKDCIEAGIVREDVSTRFIYYVSDLPLNSESTLASEDDNVNWDEGVKSINGIIRYVLGLINKKTINDLEENQQDLIQRITRENSKVVVIGTTTENMNVLNHHTASKLAEEILNNGYAVIYLTPREGIKPFMRRISQAYIQSSGFFPEAVAIELKRKKEYIRSKKLMILEYSSYTHYLNLLHCIAENTACQNPVTFLFTDTPTKIEVLTSFNGTEIINIKRCFELLKSECKKSVLIFFRTDLDNGEVNQEKLLTNSNLDWVFTRYKESTVVDVVSKSVPKQSITAHPSTEVIKKIHEILRELDDSDY